MHRQANQHARPAFTLVELLIVIVIIGLIAGLLTVAVGKAMISARDARTVSEINQLNSGMIAAKDKFGSIPPSMNLAPSPAHAQRFMACLRKAFPRASFTDYNSLRLGLQAVTDNAGADARTYPNAGGLDLDMMQPCEMLPFWLGGLPAEHSAGNVFTTSSKLYGFSMNPLTPLLPPASVTEQRTKPLYDFDQLRLADNDNDGWLEYYPTGPANPPYVYFDNKSYGTLSFGDPTVGYAWPYQNAGTSSGYMNPDTFQIIGAGEDANYGNNVANKQFPSAANWADGDNDNLTNFSTKRLEESKP